MSRPILDHFHPVVRDWFRRAIGEPSPPQVQGWPSIAAGNHTLIVAPTGSGKTLAAFLWCINRLVEENISRPPAEKPHGRKKRQALGGIRVLYISPLKALNNDIHRNLELPLHGILTEAESQGIVMDEIRSAVRTGDTPQSARTKMLTHPPDILITTPESLFLMLSSERSRALFADVQYVIVDEIHSISTTKRGVHLSLSLERLEHLVRNARQDENADRPAFVRIGLSATQKPLEPVAQFLAGMEWKNDAITPRPVTIVDAGYRKQADLKVICAARDFSDMPVDSIWSLIFPQLLQLIREHRTTLVFVNNRRLAERVAARLNEILDGVQDTTGNYAVPFYNKNTYQPPEKKEPEGNEERISVFAYHGSMSRTVREQLESDLKSGKLRALITTSALELGIDIGTVDLVVQIQSPKGIARGLQRIGRSGHLVNAQSKGRLFITHREDLVESAVVAKGMLEHAIERSVIPQNCLDVLAQQIVAMVGIEDWNTEELFDVVRQSYCYRALPEPVYHSVLEMLAGRYTNEAFRELRARIVWNKLHNELSALPGSALLALTNAGTIPDRGYFAVYLEDLTTKVGEVDEEFIYESRSGDTFILGSNVWRIAEIDANKVIVQPAPGQPARMPFWRGEGMGRTVELGIRIGEFLETVTASDQRMEMLSAFPIDSNAVRNIVEYIDDQKEATSVIPSHRTIVVEGFRDEVGDPRIVVHSCYGKAVNGLLGIVLTAQLRNRLGIDVQMLYNNDGILFRCSDAERLPLDLFDGLTVAGAQQTILEELPASPLFGALFRQNAERSLLLPKGSPGKRRPFFLQRLKSADLLQIVRQYNDFPIVIETIRECLTDVLDLGQCSEIIGKIAGGEIRVHTVQNETPSPFASTLLFDFAAVYMYQWDDPKQAERQQFAQLNRDLLKEVVDLAEMKGVLRADAAAAVESQLQHTALTRKARSAEELMDILLRVGELTEEELRERSGDPAFFTELQKRGIIIPITMGNATQFILTEEAPLYRSIASLSTESAAAAADVSGALDRGESLRSVIGRMLRSHGPLTVPMIAQRYGIREEECRTMLQTIAATENIAHGSLTADSTEEEWCYRPNLERIHRASLHLLRKEVTPATLTDLTEFFFRWQHRHPSTRLVGTDGVAELLGQFQGFHLPSELWEPELLRTRLQPYDPSALRSLTQRGEFFCIGAPVGGRTQWIGRGEGSLFLDLSSLNAEELSSASRTALTFLQENGASFLRDLREHTNLSLNTINRAIAELFWAGWITNDVADEVLGVKRYRELENDPLPDERITLVNHRHNPLKATAMRRAREAFKEVPGWNGRWSLVRTKSIMGPIAENEEKVRAQAVQLLRRYGIVAREIAKREENLLPWSLLALEYQRMELRGEIRRGYFVEGLSGMQFALPDAVKLLEESRRRERDEIAVVNACDPANPFGSGIDLRTAGMEPVRFSRVPGTTIIFDRAEPLLLVESHGARITLLRDDSSAQRDRYVRGLLEYIQHLRTAYPEREEIVAEYVNDRRPAESGFAELLRAAGFYRDKVQTMRIDLR